MPGMRLGIALIVCSAAALAADARDHFESKVRPLLARSCYPCHTSAKLGGLRLDSRQSILEGGKSGPAAVPGDPSRSLLARVITHAETLKMPPTGKLGPDEIETLRAWVRDGLYWPEDKPELPKDKSTYAYKPDWWSFQPIKQPALPRVRETAWPRTRIDRFLLAAMEARGLAPAPEVDRRAWLRRVTLALTGLPPAPEELDAFLADPGSSAHEKVVDRLLASPRYGEMWARRWLDVARYSDDKLNSTQDEPYANAFRYRNWVIRALNSDMPYDRFVMAQIAGDQMEAADPQTYEPGLGFFALSPEFQDDRVDALTRGFLGITVACAQCHDHKFDPIPTRDFYALQGVFASSKVHQTPLAPHDVVEAWEAAKKEVDRAQERLNQYQQKQAELVAEMLANRTADYLLAARGLRPSDDLDQQTLGRWKKLLADERNDYPHLSAWFAAVAPADAEREAARLQRVVLDLIDAKRRVDKENEIRLGLDPKRNDLANAHLVSLPRDDYAFWRDLFARSEKDSAGFFASPDGVYYYGRDKVERWLEGEAKSHLARLKQEHGTLKGALPPQYPFLHTLRDNEKPADIHIAIRGDRNNKGDLVPRAFLTVLSRGEPAPFTNGSGRLDLARAIASPENPLTARVIVNRLWTWHFGRGIVGTPSNFGRLGEPPTHPELLEDLAARFIEQGWSLKKLHREIVLSSVYRQRATGPEESERWLARFPRRRLDIEVIRDSMLAVAGTLDETPAEKAEPLDENNCHRTVYGFVSRRKLHPMLGLFDFPNPNSTAEQRIATNVPPQRLFFLNSAFVERQAGAFAARLGDGDPAQRIQRAYRLAFGREPDNTELSLGLAFLESGDWTQYARVLLTSNEFLYVE